MNFFLLLGAVGSVASIIALALPLQNRYQRIVHILYGVVVAVISAVAVWYWSQNNRVHSVERAATILIKQREMGYTHEGFIQASLAFLEKNKDLYPEAYARAQRLCEVNNCLSLTNSKETVSLAFALEGLLKGISTIEGGGS